MFLGTGAIPGQQLSNGSWRSSAVPNARAGNTAARSMSTSSDLARFRVCRLRHHPQDITATEPSPSTSALDTIRECVASPSLPSQQRRGIGTIPDHIGLVTIREHIAVVAIPVQQRHGIGTNPDNIGICHHSGVRRRRQHRFIPTDRHQVRFVAPLFRLSIRSHLAAIRHSVVCSLFLSISPSLRLAGWPVPLFPFYQNPRRSGSGRPLFLFRSFDRNPLHSGTSLQLPLPVPFYRNPSRSGSGRLPFFLHFFIEITLTQEKDRSVCCCR